MNVSPTPPVCQDAGAVPVRLDAYLTRLGCRPDGCGLERAALQGGHVHAVVFSSTAEVGRGCIHHPMTKGYGHS